MDHYLHRIEEALRRGDFDGAQFESTVHRILLDEMPTLVPIRGGADAGWDGAVADFEDAEGEPIPLVVTKARDVIGNLTYSLSRLIEEGCATRKVVLVTCQELSPQRRRNLFDRAQEKGFVLRHLFELHALAERFYRHAGCTRSLLGVSGRPAVLSPLPPRQSYPSSEPRLQGRKDDLAWLGSTSGDRVIVGPPGAGKTFLLHQFARAGGGLFLATEDEERLADALRGEKPPAVFVDDAHVRLGLLERLRSLRREIGARFDIVATSWVGEAGVVCRALAASPSAVRRLELLTRREILEVFEDLGVEAEEEDLRSMADQASNRPGLAVALASFWQEGSWYEVLRGKALRGEWLAILEQRFGRDIADLLACLSLGGSAGMPTRRVAQALDLGLGRIRRLALDLGSSGIVHEVSKGHLAVEPAILRPNLIGAAFFEQTAVEMPFEVMVDLAPAASQLACELLRTAALGYDVPDIIQRSALAKIRPSGLSRDPALEAWSLYVRQGPEQAEWAWQSYPGDPLDLASAALYSAPVTSLRLLFRRASASRSDPISDPHHPLRRAQSWLREIPTEWQEPVRRRRNVLEAVWEALEAEGEALAEGTLARAACLALDPRLEGQTINAARNGVQIREGLMPVEQLRSMPTIWEGVLEIFRRTGLPSWGELSAVLWNWLHPDLAGGLGRATAEVTEVMHQQAEAMLRDLVPLVRRHMGYSAALGRLGQQMGWRLGIEEDALFSLLYPSPGTTLDEERARPSLEGAMIREWSERLSAHTPREVIARLLARHLAARDINHQHPDNSPRLLAEVAEVVADPMPWIDAVVAGGGESKWAEPFVVKAEGRIGARKMAETLIGISELRALGVASALRQEMAGSVDSGWAIEQAAQSPNTVFVMALRGELSLGATRVLLRHPNIEVAMKVAAGERGATSSREPRPGIAALWRSTILRTADVMVETVAAPEREEETPQGSNEDFATLSLSRWAQLEVQTILGSDAALAESWLRRLALGSKPLSSSSLRLVEGLVEPLDEDGVLRLIQVMSATSSLIPLLGKMVGRRLRPYKAVLARPGDAEFHLTPLFGIPDIRWVDMVSLALAAGYLEEVIVDFTLASPLPRFRWGKGASLWQGWLEGIDETELAVTGDRPKARILEALRTRIRSLIEDSDRSERRRLLTGTFPAA